MHKSETLSGNEPDIPFREVIGFANDHAGFPLRPPVLDLLGRHSGRIIDVGTQSEEPVDFPDVTRRAVQTILDKQTDRVILLCGTGAGACIAANKVRGIRAALCGDAATAEGARRWNDANVLALSLRTTSEAVLGEILDAWFATAASPDADDRANIGHLADIEPA